MKTIKILNLYACLGGNRYKWDEVANIEVTAVELDAELCFLYQKRFPNDKVICGDAHEYLLHNYQDYDFIWFSPPCPTHSKTNYFLNAQGVIRYPDMSLYQEIILLSSFFKGTYVIENVIPFYTPLIAAKKIDRHLFWTNFKIPSFNSYLPKVSIDCKGKDRREKEHVTIKRYEKLHQIDISEYKGEQRKIKLLRNMIPFDLGQHIFQSYFNLITSKDVVQQTLF